MNSRNLFRFKVMLENEDVLLMNIPRSLLLFLRSWCVQWRSGTGDLDSRWESLLHEVALLGFHFCTLVQNVNIFVLRFR